MTTRNEEFDRKLFGENFRNLSYFHTTPTKVSTGMWSSVGDIWLLVRNPYQTTVCKIWINHADFQVFRGVKKFESGLHRPVETFLDVVWPYDKLWKCSPDNFLSNALSLVLIRQLSKDPTYFVKKVHFTSQKKTPSWKCLNFGNERSYCKRASP